LEIRLVQTEDDIRLTSDLAGRVWREHYPPIIGRDPVEYMLAKFQTPEAIGNQIRQEGFRYYLAYSGSDTVGYFAVVPKMEELYLSKLYLMAAHRGKGMGREMMAFVECLARELSFHRIGLVTNKHNERTLKVYQKLGFKVESATVTDIGEGYVMDDFRLNKELPD